MRLGFRRELVSKQAKNANFGQLGQDQGHSHVRESALGLDSAFFPISSENEIKFWKCKTLNRFLAISVKQERQFSFVISSVPLVPTDRCTVQLCGPGKP
jgi:hypothetical protein